MRLIAADELWENAIRNYDECLGLDELLELIENQPTIEAEPVIRCRNCIHLCRYENDEYTYCWAFAEGPVDLEDFCSEAERRDDV